MFARLLTRPRPLLAHRTFATTAARAAPARVARQSVAPSAPLGVDAALDPTAASSPSPKIFDEFSLRGRVGLVTGAHRGLGLEMAVALAEAGARVYCVDIHKQPDEEWQRAKQYVGGMGDGRSLEYVQGDVTDQQGMWEVGDLVGEREGRLDVCVANAGVLKPGEDCLEYPADTFDEVMKINVNGVLYTAQAGGRQMRRFQKPGSIILIASMSGSITNEGQPWVSYNTSKSAVKQMARSMACELASEGIRVNSLSPGYIYTKLTAAFLEPQPELLAEWSSQNPMGRLGRPDELRGVITWLASDASTFCTGSDIIVDGGHRAW
ncbi:sorbose reductase sou1 [Vararia minispora EC-137]|uniref:Sorbose reductase sou1 n=1 Tax=Vararia minispora EC-137 TaxID=1314806 RepID=A0ACB8QEB5_9AGAM|nr:sorbose reductase sou1 [Vararia minispora EC-137]